MTLAHISECNLPAEHADDCGVAYGSVVVRMLDGTERAAVGYQTEITERVESDWLKQWLESPRPCSFSVSPSMTCGGVPSEHARVFGRTHELPSEPKIFDHSYECG